MKNAIDSPIVNEMIWFLLKRSLKFRVQAVKVFSFVILLAIFKGVSDYNVGRRFAVVFDMKHES